MASSFSSGLPESNVNLHGRDNHHQPYIGHSQQDSDQSGMELPTSLRSGVEDWLLLPSVWFPLAVFLGTVGWLLFTALREALRSRKLQDELQIQRQQKLELKKEAHRIRNLLMQSEPQQHLELEQSLEKEPKQVREAPEPGDLIEIARIGYSQWAICVGDGYVVHLAAAGKNTRACFSSLFSILGNRAVVRKALLTHVVGGCFYQVNNYLDHKYRPRPINEIMYSAEAMIGEEIKYNVIFSNCEHFVTLLRYHKPHSQQVQYFNHWMNRMLDRVLNKVIDRFMDKVTDKFLAIKEKPQNQ